MPASHDDYPRRRHALRLAIGQVGMRLVGWRVEGSMPAIPRFIVVVAPHTSNWDFPLGVLAMFALDLDAHWLGKHTLFHGPMGSMMRALGGEPVDRAQPGDVVELVAARIRAADRYVLALSPEGTRARRSWKTGFHRIACAANVPVVPAWIDYRSRTVGVGAPVTMTGDAAVDLATLGAHYDARMARYPGQYVGPE